MELILLFYKMHYNIRPGLGLQCMIVLFSGHTHLVFFLVFNMHSRNRIKCTTADTESVGEHFFVLFLIYACK